jgi:hypothetical protein
MDLQVHLDFIDSHPGGSKLIEEWAGKDSTEAFKRYHLHAERCLADYDFLRIGRVIRETHLPITDKQIMVHGMVYDLTRKYYCVEGWPQN